MDFKELQRNSYNKWKTTSKKRSSDSEYSRLPNEN